MFLEKIFDMASLFFLSAPPYAPAYTIVMELLFLFGMWGIFKKCGLKPWHALIPCLREDKLGEAVGMEKEGRVAAMVHGVMLLLDEANYLLSGVSKLPNTVELVTIIDIFLAIIQIIYLARMYLALCEVFDRKKR